MRSSKARQVDLPGRGFSISLSMLALFIALRAQGSDAKPCLPNDPTGDNPGNLCLKYPPFGMSIHSNSFMQGTATQGFYGPPVSPTQPGIPVGVQSPKDGYWKRVNNQDGMSNMQTSKGKVFNMEIPKK